MSTIHSINRSLDVLEAFLTGPEVMGVTELAKTLRLSKSTLHGVLSTLEARGYLKKDSAGKYSLGLKVFELGNVAGERMDLPRLAGPALERLVSEHQETVHLTVLDRGEVVYIDKRESELSMRIVSQVGRRLPAHCTGVGKVLLAHVSDEELDRIIAEKGLPAMTQFTITDLEAFKRHLADVRTRGYAIDDQEITEGLRCVAAPIRDRNGRVVAAISVAGPSVRMTDDKLQQLTVSVPEAAREISERLGYARGQLVPLHHNPSSAASAGRAVKKRASSH